MKFRKHGGDGGGKVEVNMAAMIDVVFQLLIFFMLTLKILAPEGDFNINMPLGAVGTPDPTQTPPMDLKVTLQANEDGTLNQLFFGGRGLGNDFPACFERLNFEIAQVAGSGQATGEDIEVEIKPDYNLHYRYIVRAISACRGRMVGNKMITYIEKIKFAPIERPGG
ncbi:MAG: biopolymer transporter ExbD [Planctomycetaceae bacterium]|nr:biopolymer transporter ExbD [Planctomycetaceae bacterium]